MGKDDSFATVVLVAIVAIVAIVILVLYGTGNQASESLYLKSGNTSSQIPILPEGQDVLGMHQSAVWAKMDRAIA